MCFPEDIDDQTVHVLITSTETENVWLQDIAGNRIHDTFRI